MYCKDCVFNVGSRCENKHFLPDWSETEVDKTKSLQYSYDEGGYFIVGDYFGCVHFVEKQPL